MAESYDEYGADYTSTSSDGQQEPAGPKYHLGMIKAAAAYARGATGAGETIAIVDTGIRDTHIEFNRGRKVTKETMSGYHPDDNDKLHGTFVAALAAGGRDGYSGGTGFNMHGVAFDANLAFQETDVNNLPNFGADLNNHDDQWYATFFSDIIDFARNNGAAIINQSWKPSGYLISRFNRNEVRRHFGRTVAALAQSSTPDADKTIIVWSAGNAFVPHVGTIDSPFFFQGLGAYFPELRGHVLAVVALDQDGSIANYSSPCGFAEDFCIAAPGSGLVSAYGYADNGYFAYSPGFGGTSFAAPVVSGSLAVLRQFFRGQLGNTEVVNRLLATANRNGIYADSDTYGHGLIDLDAATSPVGPVMTSLSSDPRSRPLAGTRTALSGGAFGTAWQKGLAGVEMAGFDALDAPFFMPASSWVMHATRLSDAYPERHELSVSSYQTGSAYSGPVPDRASLSLGFDGGREIADARLSFADGWWLSYGDQAGRSLGLHAQDALPLDAEGHHGKNVLNHFSDSLAFASPYLSLVRDGPGIGWSGSGRFSFALMQGTPQFDGYHRPGGQRGLGAVLDLQLGSGLWLQAGALREREGFLGARLQGALGEVQATTHFFGINGAWVLGARSDAMGDALGDALGNNVGDPSAWRLLASAYLGRTRPQVQAGGLVQGLDTLLSSAFSMGAVRSSLWRRDDWLGLRLSQPLRTEEASLRMHLPTGRTRYGELLSQDYNVNLAPAGRHLQAEAVYHLPLAGGTLEASLGAERHPQHDRTRGIQPFMRFSFSRDL